MIPYYYIGDSRNDEVYHRWMVRGGEQYNDIERRGLASIKGIYKTIGDAIHQYTKDDWCIQRITNTGKRFLAVADVYGRSWLYHDMTFICDHDRIEEALRDVKAMIADTGYNHASHDWFIQIQDTRSKRIVFEQRYY